MLNIFSSIKKSLKSAIFNVLNLLICKTRKTSFDKLMYNSISFRLLAYFANDDLQKTVVWSRAIQYGDVKKISELRNLFGKEINIHACEYEIEGMSFPAIHLAAYKGYLDIVKKLIEFGEGVDTKNEQEVTALHAAAFGGHWNVIEELLRIGADIKVASKIGTVLHAAAFKGFSNIVTNLLKINSDLVSVQNEDGDTALHLAAQQGNLDIVAKLLKINLDVVSVQNEDGNTALHLAAQEGNSNVVAKLINSGADVNAQNEDGFTALHFAAFYGRSEVVTELLKLEKKLDLERKDRDGWTALHCAAQEGRLDVVEKLIKSGANVNAKNKYGNTALSLAIAKDHPKVIEFLKSKQVAQNIATNTVVQDSLNQASGIKSQSTPKTNSSNMQNTANTQNTP